MGISNVSSWGSLWRLGAEGTRQSATGMQGMGLDCRSGLVVPVQEIKWQATLQASVWGWWEASPSLLDLFWQECCGE